jgi:cytochrome c biogenesis protein CcdA
MEVLISASIIAAFIAGIAALLAPCCITVLLPAYFASIFRQKKTVFLMTFVFFLGLLAVFLPLGLGIAALGEFFSQFHDTIFVFGGLFLLALGITILLGIHFSLPFFSHSNVKIQNASSVFLLGVFSGFATLCCAPVLAGVLTLSVLPGSIFWGGIYSLSYVLGMVIPLFVIAFFLDKTDLVDKIGKFNKQVSYSVAGKKVNVAISDIASGAIFIFMGLLIFYLASTGQLNMGGNHYQTTINIFVANSTSAINQVFGQLPGIIVVVGVIALFGLILKIVLDKMK